MKKPLIEKRRRERINKSLAQLRDLLLDNMKRTGVGVYYYDDYERESVLLKTNGSETKCKIIQN